MSEILQIRKKILETDEVIHQLELNIANNPNDFDSIISLQSISYLHEQLTEEFNNAAKLLNEKVLDYRLCTDNRIEVNSMTNIITHFQNLFSIIYDVVSNGKPKNKNTVNKQIKAETSFGFGYVYSGSLGIALTIKDGDELFDTNIDTAIKNTLNMININSEDKLKQFINDYGIGSYIALKNWVNSHIDSNIDAEIKWNKSTDKEFSKLIDMSKLNEIHSILEPKEPIITESNINYDGELVGFDIEKNIFHIQVSDDESKNDIEGSVLLNNNIIPNLKQHYKFKLLQTTTIHLGKKPNIKYKLIEINNLD